MLNFKDLTTCDVSILSEIFSTALAKYADDPPPALGTFEADRNRQLAEWINALEKWKQGA